MKKMPCLFVRKFHGDGTFTITEQVTPGCEWALAGEGVATRKWDGTAVLVKGGVLYARYDAKKGKTPPTGAIPCTDVPDPVTGHWPHWVLANRDQDHWIQQAHGMCCDVPDGTYEAIGPKINGNAEGYEQHVLKRHGDARTDNRTRTWLRSFRWIRDFLSGPRATRYADPDREATGPQYWEGIVFHHPDGRMCKIRRDDFGLPWPL